MIDQAAAVVDLTSASIEAKIERVRAPRQQGAQLHASNSTAIDSGSPTGISGRMLTPSVASLNDSVRADISAIRFYCAEFCVWTGSRGGRPTVRIRPLPRFVAN